MVVGSDAHAKGSFAYRLGDSYRHLTEAGFEHLTFRRGGDRVRVDVPSGNRIGTAGPVRT